MKSALWLRSRKRDEAARLQALNAPFPEAERILSEFGGLRFRDYIRNQSVIRVTTDTSGRADAEIAFYEKLLNRRLYTVALIDWGDTLNVLTDAEGRTYVLYPYEALELLASCFERALEHLVHGFNINRRIQIADFLGHGVVGTEWKWPWPWPGQPRPMGAAIPEE